MGLNSRVEVCILTRRATNLAAGDAITADVFEKTFETQKTRRVEGGGEERS